MPAFTLFPSYKETLFVFFILCRVLGIFLVSPLLSNKAVTLTIRFFLSFFTAMILALVLYPSYFGEQAPYTIISIPTEPFSFWLLIATEGIKELIIGYLLGFLFNIIFEGLLWAGELIDTLIGLSTGQFFDPISNTFRSRSGQLLMLFGILFMLLADLHHVIVRLLANSFSLVPLGNFEINQHVIATISLGTSLLFIYAIKFGAIPIIVLLCGLVGLALIIRVIPEMNLLFIGLPLRVLLGLYILMIAIAYIPPLITESFFQIVDLAGQAMQAMGHTE